jgi:cobalt-zinc-cadmium efflux system protein
VLVIEVVGGLTSHSLALLTDAAHVLTDVASIGLALLAISVGYRPASPGRTHGYLRLEKPGGGGQRRRAVRRGR